MNKYKILFFDSWKGGRKHYIRLLPEFEKENFDSFLLHLGSWGNEPETILEENINGLLIRDIRYYKGLKFDEILNLEKPDLVFFLSTGTFAHRAFIRYCNLRNIPTIHSYHGVVRMQDVENNKGPYEANKLQYISFVASKIPKLFIKTFPTYLRALLKSRATIKDYLLFLGNIKDHITKPTKQKLAPDAKTTFCLVYTDADKGDAINRYGLDSNQVISIGNPDIIDFNIDLSKIQKEVSVDLMNVMYVDTAFLAVGQYFNSNADYENYILGIQSVLQQNGRSLCFRPHPACPVNLSLFEQHQIQIVKKADFEDVLKTCCAVIAEPSSLSLMPALLGYPVFIPQFGQFKTLRFGIVIKTYPYATLLYNIEDFETLLNQVAIKRDYEAFMNWFNFNSGPLPAQDMPKRVTKLIKDTLKIYNN